MQNPIPIPTDFAACDREEIHLISGIQDVGFFLTFSVPDLRIHNVSENAPKYLGRSAGQAAGLRLENVFCAKTVTHLIELTGRAVFKSEFFSTHEVSKFQPDQDFGCYLYKIADNLYALEGEPETHSLLGTQVQDYLITSQDQMKEADDMAGAAKALASGVRKLTGMDRVMVYRFLPKTWHGEVVGEDKVAQANTFMRHRFPASDIPRQARDLYLRNRIRFIQDASAQVSQIAPSVNPADGKVLDLSDSRLRAVSPVHLQYLRNMGVGCSFSVAIIVNEQLWGLVACHHFEAMQVPQQMRAGCLTLANSFSLRISMEENLAPARAKLKFAESLLALISSLRKSRTPVRDLMTAHRQVEDLFHAHGVAIASAQRIEIAGATPPRSELAEISNLIRQEMENKNRESWTTPALANLNANWALFRGEASGVLAVLLPGPEKALLLFFRPEILQTIQWGGDPRKTLQKRGYEGPINPRVSFESWTEVIEGHSEVWNDFEIRGALTLRDLIFEAFAEKEAMISELNERALKR